MRAHHTGRELETQVKAPHVGACALGIFSLQHGEDTSHPSPFELAKRHVDEKVGQHEACDTVNTIVRQDCRRRSSSCSS